MEKVKNAGILARVSMAGQIDQAKNLQGQENVLEPRVHIYIRISTPEQVSGDSGRQV